ncbi:MAG: hypothetical protein LC737_11740, partial [Chloroflexi bacterium]|nr:hypothetical protein [Chloroflexota bacterium]
TKTRQGLFAPLLPWLDAAHARLCLSMGDVTQAAALAREARQHFAQMRQGLSVVVPAWASVLIADVEVALAQQDHARAIDSADELLSNLRALGVKPYVADALLLKAKALLLLAQPDEAERTLHNARTVAESISARRVLWRIDAVLTESAQQRGDDAQARMWRALARRELAEVLHQIADEDLRAAFMQLPEVCALGET